MSTGTIRLHRVLRAKPERVYRAFVNADAMAKWIPPYGFTCKVHHLDATVGGSYKMSFENFSTGHAQSFGGVYRELVPSEKLRYTDKFDDPNLPGEMETTVILKQVSCGTELEVRQEGIPEAIPLEMCYLGWQESARAACEARGAGDPGLGQGEIMSRGITILGQVLTAVGLTTAVGGVASFFWSKVELRFLGNILSTDSSRLLWTIGSVVVALVGLALLRWARRPGEGIGRRSSRTA